MDRQIASPEQRICEDLPAFCHGVADLSLEWVQAAVDAAFYAFMLQRYSKTNTWTTIILGYVIGCGAFTTAFAPNFGKLFKRQSENEGTSSTLMMHECLALHDTDGLVRSGICSIWSGFAIQVRTQSYELCKVATEQRSPDPSCAHEPSR